MINRKDRKFSNTALLGKQRGGALILIAFMIGIMLTAFLIKNFSANSIKAEQDAKTMEALGNAKDGLISWAVSHSSAPGQMPWPDRRELTSPNYDGQSDCSNANFNLLNSASEPNFLGQIPTIASTTPCQVYPGVGNRFLDSSGNNLWYAVSRNLVRRYSPPAADPVINPGIINSPTYPWMIVRNSAGDIISDRVAVVIIAPGPVLSGQNRAGDAPLPINFLDQVTIGGNTYSNFDYAVDSEDFIIGDTTTGTFNDRLVYITIDELMASLEQRVAAEARDALRKYQVSVGRFPYAAPLGSTGNYSCVDATASGLLPLDSNPSNTCSCSSGQDCACSFDVVASVSFRRSTAPSWENSTGSCSEVGNICTCTGAGRCDRFFGLIRFECDVAGTCSSSETGDFTFAGVFENANVNLTTGSCTHACGANTVICNSTGTFSSGICGDRGIAPTIRVNTVAGSNQLVTSSNFVTEQLVAGMNVVGNGIQDNTVINSVTNATTLVMSRNATATGLVDVTFTRLPAWFEANGWQDYIYYAVSRDAIPTMTVGSRAGVQALLATTGRALNTAPFAESKGGVVPQTRLSCDISDYLDSVENANADQIYEATNKPRTLNYNDQLFIVSP